jgi:pimeloyl-ACP methyl ester carboxylesterase
MPTRDDPLDIAVGDQHIAGTLFAPGALTPGVLFVHGWNGSRCQLAAQAREVAALGCVCLTFDLRGHEATRTLYDTVSREDNLRDTLAAYDVLVSQRGVDPAAIALVGSSYGGYLAAIVTALRPVRWLVLRAPALYKDSDWGLPKGRLRELQVLDAYRLLAVGAAESRALSACARFSGHALIVESANDALVPAQVGANYRSALANAASLTYRVLENADHALSDEASQAAYCSALVNWMREMVQGARADAQERAVVARPAATVAAR